MIAGLALMHRSAMAQVESLSGTPAQPVSRAQKSNDGVPALDVAGISVVLGTNTGGSPVEILRNVSFQLGNNETIALLGRSGTGKTTLLNAVAGFVPVATGAVHFPRAVDVTRPPFAYVFQEDRLLPWRTTEDNVKLALERLRVPRRARHDGALAALSRVGLADAAKKYPWQLSGGMRSRVALARALALDAPLLLLDEPFSKLDPATRAEMHELLTSLQRDVGFAALLVTHDVSEAIRLADRAIIINAEGIGTSKEIPIDRGNSAIADNLLRSLNYVSERNTISEMPVSATHSVTDQAVSRRQVLAGGVGLAAAGVFGAKRAVAQTAPLRIGVWATGIQLALIELILEKKLFEKQGLACELVRFADVNGNTLALATDRIDVAFSVSGAGAVDLAANKRPIKIILATQSADGQLVTKKPDIKSVADLKGKMIGMAPAGSAGAAYTKAFLARNYGFEPSAYRTAGGGEARLVQLLVQGEVDAALLREVSFVQLGKRLGLRSLADQRAEWEKIAGKGALPPLGLGVAQDHILQTRRADAVAFTAAVIDGIRMGAAMPDAVSELMARSLKLSPDEAKAYADTWSIAFNGKFEDADVSSLDAAQKLFVQEGSLKAVAERSFFDQSVYRDAMRKLS